MSPGSTQSGSRGGSTVAAEAKPRKPRQKKQVRPPVGLVGLLAQGKSNSAIAKELGLDRDKVAAWARLPEVQSEVERAQRDLTQASVRRMKGLQEEALEQLAEVLQKSGVSDRDRLKAVEMVLDRTGLHKRVVIETIAGTLEEMSDEEVDRQILAQAVEILRAKDLYDLADQVAAHG